MIRVKSLLVPQNNVKIKNTIDPETMIKQYGDMRWFILLTAP